MYEVFRDWSATAPEKFNETDCRRTWNSIADDKENPISLGTLKWLAKQQEPAPGEMFAVPQDEVELAGQTLTFLSSNFKAGESFELVTQTRDINERCVPCRSKENLFSCTNTEDMIKLLSLLADCKSGAWISLNPIRAEITGTAPCDADVTSFRYTLIEADELTKEEQWAKIKQLHLPIQSVVWSGGKSLHVIVKIEAGIDRRLYDARVKALHEYLDRQQFPYDRANKNPSRLTRLPGVRRDDDVQYLAAGESGPASWQDFEAVYLAAPKHDRRSETSPLNGLSGGRGKTPVTDLAVTFLSEHSETGLPILRCFRQRWYLFKTDGWHEIMVDDIEMKITGWLQQEGIHQMERIGKTLICDIRKNLESDKLCGLPASDYRMPCWLPGGEDASGWMVFRNGALNLKALIEVPDSTPEFQPISPALFVKGCVDYDYAPDATCPMWE